MSEGQAIAKSASIPRTEAFYRRRLKEAVRGRYKDGTVHLTGETLGLACELTQIADPAAALEEIVSEAVTRWARLQAIDDLAEQVNAGGELGEFPTPDDLEKAVDSAEQAGAQEDEVSPTGAASKGYPSEEPADADAQSGTV